MEDRSRVWWTVPQLAERWQVSVDAARRIVASKKIESKRIGGARRVHADALAEYEADGIPTRRRDYAATFKTVPDVMSKYRPRPRRTRARGSAPPTEEPGGASD